MVPIQEPAKELARSALNECLKYSTKFGGIQRTSNLGMYDLPSSWTESCNRTHITG